MSDNGSSDKGFDYDRMVEDAMRSVLRAALTQVEAEGLPGNHHFYISFDTNAPGVVIAAPLKAQYPEEMTIVIQHQYWNLHVAGDLFEIELAFGGRRQLLVIPFAAVTGFVDPEAQFGLRFGADGMVSPADDGAPRHGTESQPRIGEDEAGPRPGEDAARDGSGDKVVPLDSFRNKK